MNVENDWDWEVNYVPNEHLSEKVTEKGVWEAMKRMKKSQSSGQNEVSCEMFSNEVCVKELCEVANGLLMGENMPVVEEGALLFLYKVKG